jgi:hypothetical protein
VPFPLEHRIGGIRRLHARRDESSVLGWPHDRPSLFRFVAGGLIFDMFVGKELPRALRRACLAHSPQHFIHAWKLADATVANRLLRQLAAGTAKGKLGKTLGR